MMRKLIGKKSESKTATLDTTSDHRSLEHSLKNTVPFYKANCIFRYLYKRFPTLLLVPDLL